MFQGGGAKGIAYAGALRAVRDSGCWFRAVAGSSAGAITATLIAAGLTPERMEAIGGDALKTVTKVGLWQHVRGMTGAEVPLFETSGLRDWTEELLRQQVVALTDRERDAEGDVTFEELHAASGIDLFVVVLDADDGVPVVLSHYNAADSQVAAAVVGSSAIPLALPKQRLITASSTPGEWAVHRIVDGGGWANYPRFVFADASFRAFSRLPPVDESVRTVGFALQVGTSRVDADRYPGVFVDREPERVRSPMQGPRTTAGVGWYAAVLGLGLVGTAFLQFLFTGNTIYSWKTGVVFLPAGVLLLLVGRRSIGRLTLGWLAEVFTNRVLRLGVFLALGVVAVTSISGMHASADVLAFNVEDDETGLLTVLGFVLILLLPTGVVVAAGALVGLLRFQDFLTRDAASVLGASLGAATSLPKWAGSGPGDHLILVPVSPRIDTTEFDVDSDVQERVIALAYRCSRRRIRRLLEVGPQDVCLPPHLVRRERQLAAAPGATWPTAADLTPSERVPMSTWEVIGLLGLFPALLGGFLAYAFWVNAAAGLNPRWWAWLSIAVAAFGALGFAASWRSRGRKLRLHDAEHRR